MPIYPGDPTVSVTPTHTVGNNGYEVHALSLGSQTGTHIDAPRHVIDGAGGVDSFSPNQLCAFAGIVKATGLEPGSTIDTEDLWSTLNRLDPGDGLLVETAWDGMAETSAEFKHPALSKSAAEAIAEARVAFVGIDAASVDLHDAQTLAAHLVIAGAGIPIVENLANLSAVTWARPLVTVGALPWVDLDGASARVFAMEVG